MQSCPLCTTTWVDQASRASGFALTGPERRQLLAALLARRHIILSGPIGIGKTRLAQALAASMIGDYHRQMITVQGHPWWTAKTGDVARFVEMQTRFSMLRLSYFVEHILHSQKLWSDAQTKPSFGNYVISINSMSPIEIDLYFKEPLSWLPGEAQNEHELPLRLIGTYDTEMPPDLGPDILRIAALVHFPGRVTPVNPAGALRREREA